MYKNSRTPCSRGQLYLRHLRSQRSSYHVSPNKEIVVHLHTRKHDVAKLLQIYHWRRSRRSFCQRSGGQNQYIDIAETQMKTDKTLSPHHWCQQRWSRRADMSCPRSRPSKNAPPRRPQRRQNRASSGRSQEDQPEHRYQVRSA